MIVMARSFKLFRLVFLVALLTALLACPALSSAENAATPVTGITLSESELLVPLGTQSGSDETDWESWGAGTP